MKPQLAGYQGAQVWFRGSSMWLQSANSWSSVQDFHKIMLSFFNIHWKIKFLWAGPFSLWWHVILLDNKTQAVCKPGAPPTQCLKTWWRMPGLRLGSWSARGAVLSHTPWVGVTSCRTGWLRFSQDSDVIFLHWTSLPKATEHCLWGWIYLPLSSLL